MKASEYKYFTCFSCYLYWTVTLYQSVCKYHIELIHKLYLINKQLLLVHILPGSATTPPTARHRVYVWKHLLSCTSHHTPCSNTSYKHWCPGPLFHTLLGLHQQEQGAIVYCPHSLHEYCPVWVGKHCHSNWTGNVPLSWCRLLGRTYPGACLHSADLLQTTCCCNALFQRWATRADLKIVEQAKPAPVWKVKKFCLFL